jgi:hypothetical protein
MSTITMGEHSLLLLAATKLTPSGPVLRLSFVEIPFQYQTDYNNFKIETKKAGLAEMYMPK